MKRKFPAAKPLSALLAAVLLLTPICAFASDSAPVSPALEIIANDLRMVKTGLISDSICFEPSDFDEALGLKKVSSITILSLPPVSSGRLMLGSLAVAKNQTISRASLSSLRFEGSAETSASFSFTTSDLGYSVSCSLYLLEHENAAPTVSVSGGSSSLETYKNIACFGALRAADPENDELTFVIVKTPKHGSIRLTDAAYGSFVYTPTSGYTGRDSFVYCVYDRFGNRSEDRTVNVSVKKCSDSMVFSDMDGHYAHSSAIRLSEAGVMTGSSSSDGTVRCFYPDEAVSRAEFIVYAMKALGVEPINSVLDTGFADNSDIPAAYRGYVAAAAERGYISGVSSNGSVLFYPNYVITRAEVAVILQNILSCPEPAIKPVFSDLSSIPSWAEPALSALSDSGVLSGTGGGNISPYAVMNRAMTAEILCAVMDMLES